MIKKFKDFDSNEFLVKKSLVKEAIESEDLSIVDSEIETDIPEEDVIFGKAVYDDPYLLKISRIIWNRLKNIGEFGIYHDVIYLKGIPGVWFYGIDDNKKNIVCCRDANRKVISVFNEFKLGGTNTAVVTYSTEKFGFKDILDQMIEELKNPGVSVNEELLVEAGGFGDGYSDKNIANFRKLNWYDKKYMYDLVASTKKGDANINPAHRCRDVHGSRCAIFLLH